MAGFDMVDSSYLSIGCWLLYLGDGRARTWCRVWHGSFSLLSGHHHPVSAHVAPKLMEQKACSIRLELALFSLRVCFPFFTHLCLCLNKGEWWNNKCLCAYGGPILCLCRHLLILSNARHSHILCFSHPRSVLGCAWSSWGQSIHTAWVGVHSEVVMGIHNQYYQITLNGA